MSIGKLEERLNMGKNKLDLVSWLVEQAQEKAQRNSELNDQIEKIQAENNRLQETLKTEQENKTEIIRRMSEDTDETIKRLSETLEQEVEQRKDAEQTIRLMRNNSKSNMEYLHELEMKNELHDIYKQALKDIREEGTQGFGVQTVQYIRTHEAQIAHNVLEEDY